ncbi:MAG: DUF1501 domain-containing protein, partial [Halobacteriovoraceae bacterium]|nr:DUF1501 domain-containing protein [Halobacteriovoraceae bacterium]
IDQLKKAKIFDDTLIHVTTEFEREPAETDSGTHHGVTGHSSTLICGKIEGPQVIGNIYDISHDPNDVTPSCGTWGKGAPVAELDHNEIVYGNIASSICKILGISSPTPASKSLVRIDPNSKKITPLISKAKNVKFKKTHFKNSKRS